MHDREEELNISWNELINQLQMDGFRHQSTKHSQHNLVTITYSKGWMTVVLERRPTTTAGYERV